MRVHLSGSLTKLDEDLPVFRKIIQLVTESGHVMLDDWVERESAVKEAGLDSTWFDWSNYADKKLERIQEADVMIIESSRKNFSAGYTTAVAMQINKPVLLLYNHDFYGMATGLASKDVVLATYSDLLTLSEKVMDFLEKHEVDKGA